MAMNLYIGQRFRILLFLIFFIQGCKSDKPAINVAVASNFEPYFEEISEKFKAINNESIDINIISGSSGLLSSQILNGAPFDLFLSADEEKTSIIINKLDMPLNTAKVYAIGKLSLWIPKGKDNNRCIEQLNNFKSIAIANPETAPYGKMSKQVLDNIKIHPKKTINTTNVNQAFIYTKESITDVGFIPYSSLVRYHISSGCIETFDAIKLKQSMLLLNSSAKKIHDYILSKDIQEYINKSGYNIIQSNQ